MRIFNNIVFVMLYHTRMIITCECVHILTHTYVSIYQ